MSSTSSELASSRHHDLDGHNTTGADFEFDRVELDVVVLMKIIKHTNDEGEESAMGSLVGLCNDRALEVTNCFPLPIQDRAAGIGALPGQQPFSSDIDMEQYQSKMIHFFREASLDYMQVGFYQSVAPDVSGADYVTAMYDYNSGGNANIALFYDPSKSSSGFIYLKAFRLTRKALDCGSLNDLTPEALAAKGFTFKDLLEELPIYIRKSPLSSLFIHQLTDEYPTDNTHLVANTPLVLEQGLSELCVRLDQYVNQTATMSQYARNLRSWNQQKEHLTHQRQKENEARKLRGEPPLPEDVSSLLPPLHVPDRKLSLMSGNDVVKACDDLQEFLIQSFMKLFTLQDGLIETI